MATISIDVPAATATRVTHALCVAAGLDETPANAKKAVLAWIKATVANVERSEAEQARGPVPTPVVDGVVG